MTKTVHKVSVRSHLHAGLSLAFFTFSKTKYGISIMSLRGETETISDLLMGTSVSAETASTLHWCLLFQGAIRFPSPLANNTMNMETQILITVSLICQRKPYCAQVDDLLFTVMWMAWWWSVRYCCLTLRRFLDEPRPSCVRVCSVPAWIFL